MNEKRKTWESLTNSFTTLGEELLLANEVSAIRLDELSSELAVWKRAERQSREELLALQKTVAEQNSQQDRSLVTVILDGDGAIVRRIIETDGGREAASLLRKGILEHARKRLGKDPDQILVNGFVNVYGLGQALKDNKVVNEQTFAEFIVGWNTSHPLFSLLDCGKAKEGADAKIREHLKLYAALPTCGVVYAACSHDGGYATSFGALRTEGLLDKIVLIKSYSDMAHEIKFFDLPILELPEVFIKTKLVTSWKTLTQKAPAASTTPKPAVAPKQTANQPTVNSLANTLASSSLEPTASKSTPAATAAVPKGKKRLDPNIPLHRNKPPPCNRFYLGPESCKKPNCPFGHDYYIPPEQLERLAGDAKQSPCYYAIHGYECYEMSNYGTCTMGHECPRGLKCPYGDRCRFNAPGMHPAGFSGNGKSAKPGKPMKPVNKAAPATPVKGKSPLVPADEWTSSEYDDSDITSDEEEEDEEIVLKPRKK